jgi:ABC-type branched-subunit amino acid transport system substrate-binding protein/Tfp pilus assembly protein PilF
MRTLPCFFTLLLACTTTTAQGTTRTVTVDGKSVPAEDYARSLTEKANVAALAHDDAAARAAFTKVTDELADTSSFGAASVGLARLLLEAGDAASAQRVVEKLLLQDPTTPAADDARYLLALAQLKQGDTKSAAPTLKSLVDKMPEGERAEASAKLGDQLLAQGHGAEALRYLARAIDGGAAGRGELERKMLAAVDAGIAPGDLRLLLETEAKPNTFLDEVLTFKLARVHVHLGDYTSANDMVTRYVSRYPGGRWVKDARALQASLQARVQVDAKAIGVLLPLSGKYAAYGQRALTAVELGFGVSPKEEAPPPTPELDPKTGDAVPPSEDAPKPPKKAESLDTTLTAPSGLRIVVRDTAGDPVKTRQLVKDLVEQEHVIGILGDILLDTSLPAALAAEDEDVPMLSLSRRDGVPESGPWTFRLALTARKQAQALVRLTVEGMGMKRFAIMYPKDPFGVELMNSLWDELEKREAEVTAVESYAHDQTTFTAEAKSLVGRGIATSTEVTECRQQAQQITNDYRKKKALESCGDLAKPIVDFEALFVPDSYRTVSYIVPALVAEDVLLTKDHHTVDTYRKTTGNNTLRPVQLLGVSMWNDPELTKRLGRQIDGAIFVDGFDAGDQTPRVQKFVQAFAAVHHSKPQLIEAQANDGAAIFQALLTGDAAHPAARTREALRQALAGLTDFPGVTGLVRFDETGDSATQLIHFVVDGEHLETRDPAALAKGENG